MNVYNPLFNEENILQDTRFAEAINLFNSGEWYLAHDLFEEIWHETNGLPRITIQGILQIAVAQVHLESNNIKGAMILYGEGLGRLKRPDSPHLGLNIKNLCEIVELRLHSLQHQNNVKELAVPVIIKNIN
ncbi:DUF309 domain-containing protein [Prochlorococcus sp. MIT 0601]|uniref:DUF309 domain-containing protein n=1 Tax=Prochlorococcus sp. MIT 0601 TaxID=1499498 RepID=UPI000533BCD1|nr:DUF309 domain-containing protein [Prochlorococcus sp. MIT 0601]KGG12344.1 hypothetical protein EV05_1555 [Prochlorococcus sp. MIT 0601]